MGRIRPEDRPARRRAWHLSRIQAAATTDPGDHMRTAVDYLRACLVHADDEEASRIAQMVADYVVRTAEQIDRRPR